MNKYLTKGRIALLVIFSVLIADQIIKIYVKTCSVFGSQRQAKTLLNGFMKMDFR